MGQLNFNPDDFVFTPLKAPDENKTILEYDARNRLLLMRIKTESGDFEYNSVHLSEHINKTILKNIPDSWSNDNDKIIIFGIYENGDYILEKEKLKYDFSTKTTRWIRYSSTDLTVEQAKELYEVIRAALFVDATSKEYTNAVEYLELSKKNYYLGELNKHNSEFVKNMLRQSDWRVLPDYPETFPGERDCWVLWRSKLRELDKTPEDFEDSLEYLIHLEELAWPIRPDQYDRKYTDDLQKQRFPYLENADQCVKNPELIDESFTTRYVDEVAKINELLKSYENEGITVNITMKRLLEKYKLIEELDEFKKIHLNVDGE